MARGSLVISSGGTGKGVLNFVKQSLVSRYGSPLDAGVVLLSIDGPPPEADGMYRLADGSTLSSKAADHEFYGLSGNPKAIFDSIASGSTCPDPAFAHVAKRITEDEAKAIREKVTNMDPRGGMGGCRPVGHANFCIEAPSLKARIDSALRAVRPLVPKNAPGADDQHINQTNIILVGCQFGGTGAGQLVDLGLLIRSQMQTHERLILVLILPDAFDAVVSPSGATRQYGDAKAYCGLRELARLRESMGIMDSITYNEEVRVPYSHLFDLCFLIDGKDAAGLDLSAAKPKEGVLPAVADAITSLIVDDIHTSTQLVDWSSRSTVALHYSSLGSHVWLFPADRLMRDYSLIFAETIYEHILQEGNTSEKALRRLAELMNNASKFAQLAIDLSQGRELPTAPSEWRALRPRLTVHIAPPVWPQSPGNEVWYLPREVKTAGALFGPSNAEVKQACDQQISEYLGQPDDGYETTAYGWVNCNAQIVRQAFADELLASIRDLFYEKQQDGSYAPRSLASEPNTIVQAAHFLEGALSWLDQLRLRLESDQREKGLVPDPQARGQRIGIATLARRQVDEIGASMHSGKNGGLQQQYVQASQVYLEARVWEMLIEAAKRLAADLHELVTIGWGWVGDSATGWQTYLRDICLKSVQVERTRLRGVAAEEDRAVCRTSYPRAGSDAERQLFSDITGRLNVVSTALARLSWELTEVQSPGDPKKNLEGRQLLLCSQLGVPEGTPHGIVVAKELIQGHAREVQLLMHKPEEVRAFGAKHIGPHVKQLTIWDGLYYSYRGWLRKSGLSENDSTRRSFVAKSVQWLKDHSTFLLAGASASDMPVYCFSAFTQDVTPVGLIGRDFQEELRASFGDIHPLGSLDKEVRVVSFCHGVDYAAWSYLPKAQQHYEQHNQAKVLPPVHIYPNERYAFKLEGIIASKIRHAPRQPLSPRVTCLMNDPDALEVLLLAFADGLLDPIDDPNNPNSFPYVGVTHPRLIQLGEKGRLDAVVRRYLERTGANAVDMEAARSEVSSRLKMRLSKLTTATDRQTFFQDLMTKSRAGSLFGVTQDPSIPWDQWRDVISAVVLVRAQAYGLTVSVP